MQKKISDILKKQPSLQDISNRIIDNDTEKNPIKEGESLSVTNSGKKLLKDMEGKSKKEKEKAFFNYLFDKFGDGTNEDWMENLKEQNLSLIMQKQEIKK